MKKLALVGIFALSLVIPSYLCGEEFAQWQVPGPDLVQQAEWQLPEPRLMTGKEMASWQFPDPELIVKA